MRRREFLGAVGGAVAWPLAAYAQQSTIPIVGFLNSSRPEGRVDSLRAFREGLGDSGYIVGRNVGIDYRWAYGRNDRLPALAADLVQKRVAAIAAFGSPPVQAAKSVTTTIPIVFLLAIDPVAQGLVASLNRPGGNLTGVATLNVTVTQKRLELLKTIVPTATNAALLVNPTNTGNTETIVRDSEAAARSLGLNLHVLHASNPDQINAAFTRVSELRASGLVIGTDGFLIGRSEQLAALALRHKTPTIFQTWRFVKAGGLISYGAKLTDIYHQIGKYIGRILNGDKPGELPIQHPATVELFINLKTAEALGLTMPITLLGRADKVIE